MLGNGWAVALTSDPKICTLLGGRGGGEGGRSRFPKAPRFGKRGFEASRPGLWLGTFSASSSGGMLFFKVGKSWSRGREESPVF